MKKQSIIIALVSILILLLLLLCWRFYWSPITQFQSGVSNMMGSTSMMNGSSAPAQHYPASNSSSLDSRAEAKSASLVKLTNGDTYPMTVSEVKETIDGKVVPMLAYNNSIPGPTIQVPQDSTVHIQLTNDLHMATTLHPHGLRTTNAFDGVPDVTQKPIQPGETFTYDLTFPDPGVYWYHPHLREDATQDLGLAGNFLVVPKDPKYWNTVEHEWTALVSDMVLDDTHPTLTNNSTQVENALMGTYGNTILVNGTTHYAWQAKQGERARFYITNAANVRPFNLDLDGLKMKLVAADNGKYEHETWQDHIILAPGERAIIETYFDIPGIFALAHQTPTQTYQIASITVAPNTVDQSHKQAFETLHDNSDTIASIDPFRANFNKPDDKTLRLTMDMPGHSMMGSGMMPNTSADGIEWEDTMSSMNSMMAGMTQWEIVDEASGKKNMDIHWQFKQGDKLKIKIINDDQAMHPMQHPVHLHGQRFLVLTQNGKQNTNLVWKDTVLVPAGQTAEILVDMSNPGTWMLHCHISEHAENGMMMGFTVTPNQATTADPKSSTNLDQTVVQEKVYVALEGESKISVINATNYAPIKEIALNDGNGSYQPHNVQVAPDGKSVWVTANAAMDMAHTEHHSSSANADQLFVIDPTTDEIVHQITIAPDQHLAHVILTTDSKYAFVSAQSSNKIYQIDTSTFKTIQTYNLPANSGPHGMRSSVDGKYVYIALYTGKGVGVIDTAAQKLTTTIDLPGEAVQVAIIPTKSTIAVSLYDTKQIALVDTERSHVELIALPKDAKGPVQMYATPDGKYLYVADQGFYENQPTSSLLYRVDVASKKTDKQISLGQAPHGVVVSKDGTMALVTNLVSNEVSVVDIQSNTEVKRIPVGKSPNGISMWSKTLGGTQ